MKGDFDLIVHKLARELSHINIYPIGDLHIGSPDFSEKAFRRWKDMVLADPNGYVMIVGDIMDMATKGSITNIYEATMTPFEQREWVEKEFGDIRAKILGAVQGNHEHRANKLLGICPMYDVLAKLDIGHLYRPNMAFIKVNLGERNKDRQASYTFVLAHGQAKGRTKQFPYAVDGMDIMISGHFHTPENSIGNKIVIDSQNEGVSTREFMHISVPSFTNYGGYAMKAMFMPQGNEKFPIINLSGDKKETKLIWT